MDILKKILNVGIDESTDPKQSQRIYLTNFIILLLAVAVSIVSLAFFINKFWFPAFYTLIWAVSKCFWILANRAKKNLMARVGVFVQMYIFGFVICMLVGRESGFYGGYIVVMACSFLLFESTEIKYTLFCNLIGILCYFLLKYAPLEAFQMAAIPKEHMFIYQIIMDILIISFVSLSGFYLTYVNHQSSLQLEYSNRELEKSLQQTKEAQAQVIQSGKMAALGIMASGIAHEINSPLGAIRLNVEMLVAQQKKKESPEPNVLKKLDTILSIVVRISKIISGLKTFSRDSKLTDAQETSVDQVIDNTLGLCQEKMDSLGVRITVEREDRESKEAKVIGKEAELSQVLLNLLNNSLDAIKKETDPWINIQVKRNPALSAFEIRVIDCGRGIPDEVAEKIFQPFFTTKDIGQGTGLGLSISKTIIQNHGGDLFYDKNLTNTCFTIRLPIAEGQSSPQKVS